MRISIFKTPKLLFAAGLVTLTFSCTKNELQPSSKISAAQSSESVADVFAKDSDFTIIKTDSGTTIVQYRPGPNSGNDVYADFYHNNTGSNQNLVPELPVNAWNYEGYIFTRSFIKFPKLYKFADTIQVLSAKLFLNPPKYFLNHPQGNNGANEAVIQRITSKNWAEDTLTWANQPKGVATNDQAFIPATTNQYHYAPVVDITNAVSKIISRQVHNYGFRIKLVNETPDAAVNFASSEAEDVWRRPMLQIEYK